MAGVETYWWTPVLMGPRPALAGIERISGLVRVEGATGTARNKPRPRHLIGHRSSISIVFSLPQDFDVMRTGGTYVRTVRRTYRTYFNSGISLTSYGTPPRDFRHWLIYRE